MKIVCHCGALIRVQTDRLPYRACLVADEDQEEMLGQISRHVDRLMDVLDKPEGLQAWREEHFSSAYPNTDSPRELFDQLLWSIWADYTRWVYQCERCGTVYIENQEAALEEFRPHGSGRSMGLLRGKNSRSQPE